MLCLRDDVLWLARQLWAIVRMDVSETALRGARCRCRNAEGAESAHCTSAVCRHERVDWFYFRMTVHQRT